MANVFITPTIIAKTGISTLYNVLVLANLVWRDFDQDFSGKQGSTINARKPAVFTAEEFSREAGTKTQTATEEEIAIKLDKIADVTFAVTDEDMTLSIANFTQQLLDPAMEAIAQKIDGDLAEKLVDTANTAKLVAEVDAEGEGKGMPHSALVNARTTLTRNKYPTGNRYAVLSPEAIGKFLNDLLFVRVNESGSSEALRDAQLGRRFGLTTYESQVFGVGPENRGEADGVVFHQTAVTLASRPLISPKGVAPNQVAIANYKNLSLRTVYQYNRSKKQDEVSTDLLYGLAVTRPNGSVEVDLKIGS